MGVRVVEYWNAIFDVSPATLLSSRYGKFVRKGTNAGITEDGKEIDPSFSKRKWARNRILAQSVHNYLVMLLPSVYGTEPW